MAAYALHISCMHFAFLQFCNKLLCLHAQMVKAFAAGAAVESVTLKTLFDMGMYPGDTNMLASYQTWLPCKIL